MEKFLGEVYLGVPEDFDFSIGPSNAIYLLRVRSVPGLSSNPRQVYMGGGNSGFMAVNIAYLKRARRIVLLGYDYCYSGQHWHQGYSWQCRPNNRMYLNWAQRLDETSPQLKQAGTQVLDASPHGKLTAFPKISLDQVPLEGE